MQQYLILILHQREGWWRDATASWSEEGYCYDVMICSFGEVKLGSQSPKTRVSKLVSSLFVCDAFHSAARVRGGLDDR